MNAEDLLKEILEELKNINSRLDQLDIVCDRLSEIAVDVSVIR